MSSVSPYLLTAIGGALGAMARLGVGDLVARRLGAGWPYGTLFINLTGCFAIALFLGLVTDRSASHLAWRYLFATGFLGAYTTFSTFAFETQRLFAEGAPGPAIAYLVLSNIGGLAAVVAGLLLGRAL